MLNFQITEIVDSEKEDLKHITLTHCQNKETLTFTCKQILDCKSLNRYNVHRAVMITAEPVIKLKKYKQTQDMVEYEDDTFQIVIIPPSDQNAFATYLFQANSESGHCPDNHCIS